MKGPPTTRQNLDFLPAHAGNQQSCLQENSVRCVLYETLAHICNKLMLIAQDYIIVCRCIT